MAGNRRAPNSAGWFWILIAVLLIIGAIWFLTTQMPWVADS